MTIKGDLLSNIAVVRRFEIENIEVHLNDRLHFALEFSGHRN